jgi:hypothetical protein
VALDVLLPVRPLVSFITMPAGYPAEPSDELDGLLNPDSGWMPSAWVIVVILIGWLLFTLGRRWYRQRQAAKSADRLLAEVLRDKDAFRR